MRVESLEKIYYTSTEKVIALKEFSYKFEKENFYTIMGSSGSGKSTLIRILGLMDNLTSGKYLINEKDVSSLNDFQLSSIRMNNIGFVYQDYYLDRNLRAYENVMLPMLINQKINKKERKIRAIKLLESLGLGERASHFPNELSGGEQQRVCIARALANNPDYILADEPTGNLDEENEIKILEILKQLSKSGKCVVVVSHSDRVLQYADEVLNIKAGKLVTNENSQ